MYCDRRPEKGEWTKTNPDKTPGQKPPRTIEIEFVRRERVNPQNRKVQRIYLDPPLHPISSGNLGPINCEGLSFFSELGQKATGHYRRDARNCFPVSAHFDYHSEF